ncbi:MAG: [Firmicutes bacterium]|nr:[FeFe] hydrogenase H-cluster maturation GTPase HydF [Bacillota bacterium]
MGLNDTPGGERVHIGFFGRRNAGKSSVVNAVTGQDLAIVSDVKGTTTDPVYKAMELLPLGPVMIIDTPGFDDEGMLGELRVKKTRQVLNKTDVAVLVVDSTAGKTAADEEIVSLIEEKNIPYIVVMNKCDLLDTAPAENAHEIYVSAMEKKNIHELKERMARLAATEEKEDRLVGDLLSPHDLVVLVIPIDKAAPKGRLILPQQQTIRDILESGAMAVVARETELEATLASLDKKPAMVITDSQVFEEVAKMVPADIPLTSFSVLMARYKGFMDVALKSIDGIKRLKDGDKVLIAEGCTHHRQCNDIGTVKIPNWLKQHTGADLEICTCSGTEFPEDLTPYALVVHCGGCMLNQREVKHRANRCLKQGVPMLNYGLLIAHINGILDRSIEVFQK